MSADTPAVMVRPLPPQAPQPTAGSSAWPLWLAAFAGTVALIWGFETSACRGLVAGAVAAMMRAGFLVLTHLPELGLLVLIFAAHLGMAYLASRRPPFRGRNELLTLALPLASFLLGWALAGTVWVDSGCALHPWR